MNKKTILGISIGLILIISASITLAYGVANPEGTVQECYENIENPDYECCWPSIVASQDVQAVIEAVQLQNVQADCNANNIDKTKCEGSIMDAVEYICDKKFLGDYYWKNNEVCLGGCNLAKTACFDFSGKLGCDCDGTPVSASKTGCMYKNQKNQEIIGKQKCDYNIRDSTCSLTSCEPVPEECRCEDGKKVGEIRDCEGSTEYGRIVGNTEKGTQKCLWDQSTKSCDFEKQCDITPALCKYPTNNDPCVINGKSGTRDCNFDGSWDSCVALTDVSNAPITCADSNQESCTDGVHWYCQKEWASGGSSRNYVPKGENCQGGCENNKCKIEVAESDAGSSDCEICTQETDAMYCTVNERVACEDAAWGFWATKLCIKKHPYSCTSKDDTCTVLSEQYQQTALSCKNPQQPGILQQNTPCTIPQIKIVAQNNKEIPVDYLIIPPHTVDSGQMKIVIEGKITRMCTCTQGTITCA